MPDIPPLRPAPTVLAAGFDDETVLLDLASKRYFQLNASGAAIWDALAAGCDRAGVVETLVTEFDVAAAEAETAVDAFVATLRARGLLAPAP